MTSTETSTPNDRHILKGQLFRHRSSRVHLSSSRVPGANLSLPSSRSTSRLG